MQLHTETYTHTQTLYQCTWPNTELTTCAFDICTERMHSYGMSGAKVLHLCLERWVDAAVNCVATLNRWTGLFNVGHQFLWSTQC